MPMDNPWDGGGRGADLGLGRQATASAPTASPSLSDPSLFQNPNLSAWGAMTPNVGNYFGGSAPSTVTNLGAPAASNPTTPRPTTPASPWMTNVTSTDMAGNVTPLVGSSPNINYVTQAAASDIARRYGGNLLSSGNVMGGSVSDPMYGVDFGSGDPMSAGQIAFWEQRGDTPDQIKSRLFQSPAWWTSMPGGAGYVDPNIVRLNDVNWNFSSPVERNLAPGAANPGFVQRSQAQDADWRTKIGDGRVTNNSFGLPSGQSVQTSAPRVDQNGLTIAPYDGGGQMNALGLFALLASLLGNGNMSNLLAQNAGTTTRRPNLTNARNTAFQRNTFYPTTEPRLY